MQSHWPVSIKGVVCAGDAVLLARNDRDEWELPGGRLEIGETPQQCVAREIAEETGLTVRVGPILSSWVFEVIPGTAVVLVAYGCHLDGATLAPDEHTTVAFCPIDELGRMRLPDGYRTAIADWLRRSTDARPGQPKPASGRRGRITRRSGQQFDDRGDAHDHDHAAQDGGR